MSALNNSALIGASGSTGYQISRSVRLRASASAFLNRTPSVDGNRKRWTWSGWVKRGSLGSVGPLMSCTSQSGNDGIAALYFENNQLFTYYDTNTTNPAGAVGPAVYRDPSAWYHIVWAVDAANSIHYVYVNNVLVSTDTSKYPVNYDYAMNRAGYVQRIGTEAWGASNYFDGYLTEINFIDGQSLTPSSFGETNPVTGVWQPKKYTGTYGTNGFYLNFSDNSAATAAAIGKDYSGNGNNWTPNNISVTAGVTYDSMLDVPTQWADGGNGRGNYCVINPLSKPANVTLSNANLTAAMSTTSGHRSVASTFYVDTGSWFWEITPTTVGSGSAGIGVANTSFTIGNEGGTNTYFYYADGTKNLNNTSTSYGASYTSNDVIGVAFDATNGTLTFYKNGTSQGQITGIPTGVTYVPFMCSNTSVSASTFVANFGQRPFAYTPPTGFKALNTLNLPTPTILKGNQYMNATLWNGNSTNATVITTTLGTVDFAWVKKRNGADDHRLANTVTGGNRHLKSNTTEAESTATTVIQAFSGSTFTLGTDNSVNATGGTYVGWTWQEGATQGFDIVTYTGNGGTQNISHNLGVAPRMMIVKSRSTAQRWTVFHTSISNAYIYLNETFAADTANAALRFGNNSAVVQPTSSVFTIGNSVDVNQNTTTYVAYLFSEVAGFSKFGSYTGNGSADGPFVFCGFRPRFVMVKRSDSTGNWFIWDSARDPYNTVLRELYPDQSASEFTRTGSNDSLDLLSNGFKIRFSSTFTDRNASGGTYIFAAFAENPFKNALAR